MEDHAFLELLLKKIQKLCSEMGSIVERSERNEHALIEIKELSDSFSQRCEQRRTVIQENIRSEVRRLEENLRGNLREVEGDLDKSKEKAGATLNGKINGVYSRINGIADAYGKIRSDHEGLRSTVNGVARTLASHMTEHSKERRSSASMTVAFVMMGLAILALILNAIFFVLSFTKGG